VILIKNKSFIYLVDYVKGIFNKKKKLEKKDAK